MKKLGKLEKVKLRDVWKHEALDFTQWMAKEENISLLLDEISISAENIKPEDNAGKFNVDISADEVESGKKIIIENQLEKTDHSHLGQLLTYASSFDACIIVWVVAEARDEHKRAIEWFNENMQSEISFFLVTTEVWQIGESKPAVKFNVVVEPNDWAKINKNSSTYSRELTETKLNKLEFWNAFKDYANTNETKLKIARKPRPQHWYSISFGSSKAGLACTTNKRDNYVGIEIYINDDKSLYHKLLKNKDNIDAILEDEISWEELPEKKASRIRVVRKGNPENKDRWEEYFQWLIKNGEILANVFNKFSKP
jgi:hypothetical protein